MSQIIILYAHGSKDPRWQGTFECFSAGLSKTLENQEIRLAYMEFISPTLMDVVEESYNKRCKNFVLVPLFMAAGAHVGTDLPAQVTEVKEKFKDIEIDVKPPIGEHPRVFEVMREVIKDYVRD